MSVIVKFLVVIGDAKVSTCDESEHPDITTIRITDNEIHITNNIISPVVLIFLQDKQHIGTSLASIFVV